MRLRSSASAMSRFCVAGSFDVRLRRRRCSVDQRLVVSGLIASALSRPSFHDVFLLLRERNLLRVLNTSSRYDSRSCATPRGCSAHLGARIPRLHRLSKLPCRCRSRPGSRGRASFGLTSMAFLNWPRPSSGAYSSPRGPGSWWAHSARWRSLLGDRSA